MLGLLLANRGIFYLEDNQQPENLNSLIMLLGN